MNWIMTAGRHIAGPVALVVGIAAWAAWSPGACVRKM
jgi:hypothetical protein